jgi:hypothetical protein
MTLPFPKQNEVCPRSISRKKINLAGVKEGGGEEK